MQPEIAEILQIVKRTMLPFGAPILGIAPVVAAGLISGGASLLGKIIPSIFGGKSPEERQYEAQKAQWDSNEVARVGRCQNLTNWTRQYFANKGVKPGSADAPAIPATGDNCPPPQPFGVGQPQGQLSNLASGLFNAIGTGVGAYAADKYGSGGGVDNSAISTPTPSGGSYYNAGLPGK
jgi:hypothetical protein